MLSLCLHMLISTDDDTIYLVDVCGFVVSVLTSGDGKHIYGYSWEPAIHYLRLSIHV